MYRKYTEKIYIIYTNTHIANQRLYTTVKHVYWYDKMVRQERKFYNHLKLNLVLLLFCYRNRNITIIHSNYEININRFMLNDLFFE